MDAVAVRAWRDDYPWLQLAFRQSEGIGRALAEEWRWRIEEDLKAPLDYQVRVNGTAAVWCGLSSHDFEHEPTPRDLLRGLDTAYRQELERRGWQYPDLNAAAPTDRGGTVTVGTRYGPVEISWAVRDRLVEEIRRRGSGDFVVRVFDAVGASRPVSLDRKGKIVVLDALWGLREDEGNYPQLRELQDKLKDEITAQ
jgi:hypothetical protein